MKTFSMEKRPNAAGNEKRRKRSQKNNGAPDKSVPSLEKARYCLSVSSSSER